MTAAERMFGMPGSFRYGRCPSCGMLSLEDVPADLAPYYPTTSYYSFSGQPDGERPRSFDARRWIAHRRNSAQMFGVPAWARPLARWRESSDAAQIAPWIRHARRDRGLALRVLDIGCGAGDLLRRFEALGFDRLDGLDPFQDAPVKRAGAITIRAIHATDLRDVEYDLIVLDHSLEHIPDQVGTLRAVAGALSPKGVVRVEVPVADSEVFDEYGEEWIELDAPRHLHLHTRVSLLKLAEMTGFEVIECIEAGDAFEYWGSEMYRRGLTFFDASKKRYRDPNSVFTQAEMSGFDERVRLARGRNRSGRVRMHLRAASA